MKSLRRLLGLLFLGLIFLGLLTTAATAQSISPYLFGQNMWLTNGSEGRPGYIDQLWPAVEASGVKMVRIGGIGYDNHMPPRGTLLVWVRAIKDIGAEPLLQVSQFGGPEEAAQWVRFFNVDAGLRVRFWSIGNEPVPTQGLTAEEIADYVRSKASAMRDVDAEIQIFAPDAAWYNVPVYEALLGGEADISGRDEKGRWYVDGFTFHNYPNDSTYSRNDVVFNSAPKIERMISSLTRRLAYADELHGRTGADALKWGITEFNLTWSNPSDLSVEGIAVPSFINGQFWAEIFGLAMRYGAFTATPWCIQESDRSSTYFGYIGGPPEHIPHSTYYHMQLMSAHMGGEYMPSITNDPFVKAIATREQGRRTILLMNQHSDKSVPFRWSDTRPDYQGPTVAIWISGAVQKGEVGTLPPNSSTLIVLDEEGSITKQLVYSQDGHAALNLPPQRRN